MRDLIDLEFFLAGKGNSADAAPLPADFDRKTYLEFSGSQPETSSRRELVRFWLQRRRELEHERTGQEAILPGTAYAETLTLLRITLALLGVVLGATLVWGLFSYQGRQPINIFTCFWVLVVPQVLLLLFLLISGLMKRIGVLGSFRRTSAVLAAFSRRMILRFARVFRTRISAESLNRIRSAIGLLGRTRTVYGSVFYWPFFLTGQLFGIFFNIGILAAILLRVTITDLAFGWQSTLQLNPETVYSIVRGFSAPWAWLFSPPIAHPTLEQIAGSKMILKEGIYLLETRDLTAWWPFLFFAVLFYGFLPRVVLAFSAWVQKHRELESLEFKHAACDRLVERMRTPRLQTASRPYAKSPSPEPPSRPAPAEEMPFSAASSQMQAIVLIPEELMDRIEPTETNSRLHHFLDMDAAETLTATADPEIDSQGLEQALSKHSPSIDKIRIVIVQEAWQPPIKETLSWLEALRSKAGKTTGMVIALIGKPSSGIIFTPAADTDRLIWEQAVNGLADPYMRVETLGG